MYLNKFYYKKNVNFILFLAICTIQFSITQCSQICFHVLLFNCELKLKSKDHCNTPPPYNFVFQKSFSLKERREQHYIILTLEVLKYCINARGVLNLWTLEMSNKAFEMLSHVRDAFQYKYTRGVIISRSYVRIYSGVELHKPKTIVCHYSIECYLQLYFICKCLRYDCTDVYSVILQTGLSQRKGGMI